MFKNYFIVSLRNFWRNRVFSAINVLGLAIGISASLVIFLVVYYEMSYDTDIKNGDRVYRVVMDMKFNGDEGHSAALPAPLGSAVQNEMTGIEKTMPLFTFQGDGDAKVSIVRTGAAKPVVFKKQPGIVFTNAQYLQLRNYTWLAGSSQKAMQQPFSTVLTASKALQYFPGLPYDEVVGKLVTYNDDLTTTVTGVVNDLHANSTFSADEFISLPTIAKTQLQKSFMMNVWDDWMAYSTLWVQLAKGTNAATAEQQMNALFRKYNKNAAKDAANSMTLKLQPLSDVHFNGLYQDFRQRVALRSTMYGLLAIAAFLLLLGCINFINLTTAHAARRAKEVGIRKTMGSKKKQLVLQFLSETFLVTLFATLLSVVFTPLLLRMFSDFTPPGLSTSMLYNVNTGFFLAALVITVSFLAGLYPALILAGYNPVMALKNQAHKSSAQTRSVRVRKTLTVSQFVIAQFFVIATIIVSKQISYSINSDMGFRKDAVLNFTTPHLHSDTLNKTNSAALINKLRSIPGIQLASCGFLAPATPGAAFGNIKYTDGKKEVKENVQVRWGDENYLKVYQVKLVAGRNVAPNDSARECLINEEYAREIGFQNPAGAVNRQIYWGNDKYTITGVMRDFHEHDTHALIDPIVFRYGSGNFFHIALQPQSSGWTKTIAGIETAYKSIFPDEDFSYSFFDETIAKFYTEETNTARLLAWSTGLTILISCLGLLGLVIYTTETRYKEIGIRKVLGASVANIVSILSKDFVVLVGLAFVIAAPLAWWAAHKWLEGFAYKTAISWWVFVVSGAAMIALAVLTLSVQTIKAAVANPVKAIKAE
ncbi:MAG TPA: ABC transporter permease [Chitinophagaceae bacterium]|nr:ABC transporter permease [Chitinophagaceae bacterium]